MHEKFPEIEILKKNKTDIIELQYSVSQYKHSGKHNNKLGESEERIYNLEDRSFEISNQAKKKKKRL